MRGPARALSHKGESCHVGKSGALHHLFSGRIGIGYARHKILCDSPYCLCTDCYRPCLACLNCPSREDLTGTYRLMVDGQPYSILGAQVRNYYRVARGNSNRQEPLYKDLMHNTAEIRVYGEVIEPQPGKFNFASVDSDSEGARKKSLRNGAALVRTLEERRDGLRVGRNG